MGLLLIKIGKAFSAVRRDGFWLGGKRVLQSLLAMLKAIFGMSRNGDILFITGGVGDSARYRAEHVAEELDLHGFRCAVTVQDNPFLKTYAGKFKIFIFHRTLFTSGLQKIFEKIKERKKEIIFETDDLVFDPRYLRYMDYYQKMNAFEKKLYEKGVGGEILRDPYVKVCTTTTEFLAEKLKKYGKKVFIVPNRLSEKDLATTEMIVREKKSEVSRDTGEKKAGALRIGYFSGTISHNKDFASITEALLKLMEKYPQTELFLGGPLDIDNKLNKFSNRIRQFAYVPREKHFSNLAMADINLAPLELNNPFCEAKSELKFFEAAIVGVPTVAVRNRTFSAVIEDGKDGFLADTMDEWFRKLEKLVNDDKLRKEMGRRAREKALRDYANKNSRNEEYYDYLKSKL